MRISDWSSDVCSSDLAGIERQAIEQDAHRPATAAAQACCAVAAEATAGPYLHARHGREQFGEAARFQRRDRHTDHDAAVLQLAAGAEIGRASCRERVCQSV